MTIDLTGVEPGLPEPLAADLARAVGRALRHPAPWRSPPSNGLDSTRAALATLAGSTPEQTIVTSGVRAACAALASLVDGAIVEEPTFADIPAVLRAARVPVTTCAWQDMPDLPVPAGRLLWWVTSPARNPDGAQLPEATVAHLVSRAAAGDIVVRNAAYAWYGKPEVIPGSLETGTLAKISGGAARLGWLTSRSPLARDVLWCGASGPPAAWQRAWAEILATRSFAEHVTATVTAARDALAEFVQAAPPALRPTVTSPAGPSLLIALPSWTAEDAAVAAAQAGGVRISGGANFLARSPSVRLCFTGVATGSGHQAAELLHQSLAPRS